MNGFRACAVVPTHNHEAALGAILTSLRAAGLPVIVIDDGSAADIGERISALCATHAEVEYKRQAINGGKGFAVMCGIARAQERGFTPAVQVDADGQHDLASLDALLAAARANPLALVTGVPRYTQPIPLAR